MSDFGAGEECTSNAESQRVFLYSFADILNDTHVIDWEEPGVSHFGSMFAMTGLLANAFYDKG